MKENRGRGYAASYRALRIALFICVAAALLMCLKYFNDNYTIYDGNVYKTDVTAIELRGAQDIDVEKLCRMKNLEFIDLRDSALTVEQADELQSRLPDCILRWTITIAGQRCDNDTTELELVAPAEEDLDKLRLFENLTQLHITDCSLYERLWELKQAMTDCEITWTVPIAGEEYLCTTDSIVLPEATEQDIAMLEHLPELVSVDFTGCKEYDRIFAFAQSHPDCFVRWSVELLGVSITSEQTEADISGNKVEDISEVERAISLLPKLQKLIMCDCGLSYETLDELDKKYPDVKIVWRVYFGKWSLRTDATSFSTQQPEEPTYRLVDDEVQVLKYCTDLEMLDLGHQSLTSVDAFADLTNLKVLILADNRISDISPLYKLTKMEYFEMFINRISDISVMKYMPNLTDVNFCWNYIADPSPLYDHKHLERVWMCGWMMSEATKQEFQRALPNVEFDLYSTYGSTNGSWRYNSTFAKIRDGFRNHNGMNDYHW